MSAAAVATTVVLLASAPLAAEGRGAVIDAPVAGASARLAPGETLELVVRLRQPLTPPPGVQQPRVWAGWSVGLRRVVDLATAGASPVVEYRLRPFRLRPAGGDRYRLFAVVPPWLPGGTYDAMLRGPGVEDETLRSVVIDDHVDLASVLDVTLPPGVSGIAASLAGESLRVVAVAPAGWDGESGSDDGRVLRLGLPSIAAQRLRSGFDRTALGREVAFAPVTRRSCAARVRLLSGSRGPAGGSLAAYEEDPDAVSVVWEIGDRTTAAGPRAHLSLVADTGTLVRATGFDGFGRPCRAELRVPGRAPAATEGCGCSVGAGRGGMLRVLTTIFCLSLAAGREYDAVREPLTDGSFLQKR